MQNTKQTAPAPKTTQAKPPAPVPPPEFQAANIVKMDEAGLVKLLKDPSSTTFQKAKACQFLASTGTREAVPALAALLTDPQLSHYARYGLEPLTDPSADAALRDALGKVNGRLLVGVINSIGQRKDAGSIEPLTGLMKNSDIEVAAASAAALGSISGVPAAKALEAGLQQTTGELRAAVAGACLVCAEGLLAKGDRGQALSLYNSLTQPDVPKPVRLAAMHGIIAAETSLSRPR